MKGEEAVFHLQPEYNFGIAIVDENGNVGGKALLLHAKLNSIKV